MIIADNICKCVLFLSATLISPTVCELILSSNCGKKILSCKSFLLNKQFTYSHNICLCSKLVVPNFIETLKCIVICWSKYHHSEWKTMDRQLSKIGQISYYLFPYYCRLGHGYHGWGRGETCRLVQTRPYISIYPIYWPSLVLVSLLGSCDFHDILMIHRDLWHGVKLLPCTPYLAFDGSSWSHSMQSSRGFSKKRVGHLWQDNPWSIVYIPSHSFGFLILIVELFSASSNYSDDHVHESYTRFPADFRVTILFLQLFLEHNQLLLLLLR